MKRLTFPRLAFSLAAISGATLTAAIAWAAAPADELVGPDPHAVNETGNDVAAFGAYSIASSQFENNVTLPGEGPELFESRVRLFHQGNHVRDYYVEPLCEGQHTGAGERNTTAIGPHAIVVGMPRYSCEGVSNAGAVLAYSKDGNEYSSEPDLLILPADEAEQDLGYGKAVAAHGDWVAVGAPGRFAGNITGGVDMWRNVGGSWVREGWLPRPAALAPGSLFGAAVEIHQNLMVVGAPSANKFFVYEHKQGAWTLTAESEGNEATGQAVDISSSFLVSSKNGVVSVYRKTWNSWTLHQTLRHPEFPGAPFGESVAIDEHRMILGSPTFNNVGIYALQGDYVRLGEVQIDIAGSPSGLNETRRLGFAVAMDGDDIVVADNNANYVNSSTAEGAVFAQKFYWVY